MNFFCRYNAMGAALPEGKVIRFFILEIVHFTFHVKGVKLFTWGDGEVFDFLKQSRNTKRATQIKVALSIYYLSNLRSNVKRMGDM